MQTVGVKVEVPILDTSKITFEEAEIGAGEQVAARFVPFFAWRVNGVELGNGTEREIVTLKAKVGGLTIEGTSGTTVFTIKCTVMKEAAGNKKIIGGRLGKMETKWELTGCTASQPANCTIENGEIKTESLTGFIVQGVDASSFAILLQFRPTTGTTFMIIKPTGAACGLPATITVSGGVLAQALNVMEVLQPEFRFEPTVKTTFTWSTGGTSARERSGLFVGSEQTEISGTMFFSLQVNLGFSVT